MVTLTLTMKFLVCVVALFSFAFADEYRELVANKLHGYDLDVPEGFAEELLRIVENEEHGVKASSAIINDYVDKIFSNLKQFIIDQGMDPMDLPDVHADLFPSGYVNMTIGVMQGASTISRYGDVVVTYNRDTRYYTLTIPILFDALQFTYDWKARVLLITYDGGVLGKVNNFKMNAVLGFNFTSYQASLDKFDITDSGTLTLKFSGNALIDWLINGISTVISTILHPIIIRIIQSMVQGPMESLVEVVNEIINNILHPTTVPTSIAF